MACLAAARRSARTGDRVWAVCSATIGAYYLVAFAGIASGAGNPLINIAFTIAVVLGWTWITQCVSVRWPEGRNTHSPRYRLVRISAPYLVLRF